MVSVIVDTSKLKPLGGAMKEVQKRGMQLTGQDMLGELQRNSPRKHGRLASWAVTSQSASEIKIQSPAEYTAAHNWGSTHMIKPKNKKALHWGGKPGYFSKGHEITITGKHFVEKSINAVTPRIQEHFQIAISEVLG
jgi:hypothetical protein